MAHFYTIWGANFFEPFCDTFILPKTSEVLSCMEIPHIIFDGTGYCFDGNYYSIIDVGIERMVLKVTKIQESDIDPLCLEILKNQM